MAVVVPKTLAQCQKAHVELISRLVEEWWTIGSRFAGTVRAYLVGTKGRDSHNTEIWTTMRVAPETEEGELCVRPESMGFGWTRERCYAELKDWLRNVPIFTFAD